MIKTEIFDFYKKTSMYTDLGMYKEFAIKLPNDISELSLLQRKQIIHPIIIWNHTQDGWQDDLNKISNTSIIFEDDIFTTAISMLAELLRRDNNYSINRKVENKIHVTCRGEAILLASILKAKGIPARVRSGFAEYLRHDGIYHDHWITEYYNCKENKWTLVDADNQWGDSKIKFNLNNIPKNEYGYASDIYLDLRNNKLTEDKVEYASEPVTIGIKAAIRCFMYDFHCLMNDEIIFDFIPKYILNKNFELSEEELKELDSLALLMKNPDENFDKIKTIWNTEEKFRIMSGGLN
jgi:hypothetical protein